MTESKLLASMGRTIFRYQYIRLAPLKARRIILAILPLCRQAATFSTPVSLDVNQVVWAILADGQGRLNHDNKVRWHGEQGQHDALARYGPRN